MNNNSLIRYISTYDRTAFLTEHRRTLINITNCKLDHAKQALRTSLFIRIITQLQE